MTFGECQKQVLNDLLTADNVSDIKQVSLSTGTRKAFYTYLASTESFDMTRAANKKLKGVSLQQAKDVIVMPGQIQSLHTKQVSLSNNLGVSNP